jgi:hypothetical protein
VGERLIVIIFVADAACRVNSCDDTEASRIEATGIKARALSTTIVQINAELTKSLTAARRKIESKRSASLRTKEDVNRLVLAAHEIGRLRV